ncbi:hypothetical protein ACOSP7_025616 [Xanthoceras sorbifolium]
MSTCMNVDESNKECACGADEFQLREEHVTLVFALDSALPLAHCLQMHPHCPRGRAGTCLNSQIHKSSQLS